MSAGEYGGISHVPTVARKDDEAKEASDQARLHDHDVSAADDYAGMCNNVLLLSHVQPKYAKMMKQRSIDHRLHVGSNVMGTPLPPFVVDSLTSPNTGSPIDSF